MKSKTVLFLFFSCYLEVLSQQIPQFTQYILNPYILNPAYIGTSNNTDFKCSYRKQWIGINDSPLTLYATANGHFGKDVRLNKPKLNTLGDRNHGWGITIMKDQTGPLSTIRLQASYAYNFKIGSKIRISFGISGGVKNFSLDLTSVKLNDATNNIAIPINNFNHFSPDLSAGVYVYSVKFFLGVSAQNLLFTAINKSVFNLDKSKYQNNNYYDYHFFVQTGYVHAFNNTVSLVPSIVIKHGMSTKIPSFDFNLKVKINSVFSGINYRTTDAISIYAGAFVMSNFEIAIAYDYGVSNIASYASGSFETLLAYKILPKIKIKSPSDYW